MAMVFGTMSAEVVTKAISKTTNCSMAQGITQTEIRVFFHQAAEPTTVAGLIIAGKPLAPDNYPPTQDMSVSLWFCPVTPTPY